MDFAILGPLRVGGPDGAIEIRAPKQRALLAMLLLAYRDDAVSSHAADRRPVGRGPAADRDQGAAGPRLAAAARARRGDPIVTRAAGYAVRWRRARWTSSASRRSTPSARAAPPQEAAELLREALARFRGPPLADAPLYGPASGEADRLDELRLAALERRVELDLELGRDRELVGELERADRRAPLPRALPRAS